MPTRRGTGRWWARAGPYASAKVRLLHVVKWQRRRLYGTALTATAAVGGATTQDKMRKARAFKTNQSTSQLHGRTFSRKESV